MAETERDTRDDPISAEEDAASAQELADAEDPKAPVDTSDPNWSHLLEYLLNARGFDFHGYKPASLARRIRKRMDAVHVDGYSAYQEYLVTHPHEFGTLFNTILINVTGFFRDPAAWEAVQTRAIPPILAAKRPDEPIRMWSAGCATGEEAYTLAILLTEAVGTDEFRERVKIYATDIDEEALNAARHGAFTDRQVLGVPANFLSKYFDQVDGLYFFRKELRRSIIFGRHDLINDAPISRIDLLTCRNTLMYLNSETQARVLARLHFALNEGGFLLLGRAETLMAHGNTFVPVDLRRRLSRKNSRGPPRGRKAGDAEAPPKGPEGDYEMRLRTAAIDVSPVAQLVVDAAGTVTVINERARALFGLRPGDVGRPLKDLQLSYRPVELRSLIERAETERRPVVVKEIDWPSPMGETRWLDLHVAPLNDPAGATTGTILTFTDVTAHRRLQWELEESHQELETAYEELQYTNEELETMNEELQSTNEELQTMNDELRTRGDELNSANAFLESILTSLQGGVVVVDRELRVLAWNDRAEDLWGVREGEVRGQYLMNLDIGLPVDRLRSALRKCVQGESDNEEMTIDAINRRGRPIRCNVSCTPLRGPEEDMQGAILVMEVDGDAGT